MPIRAEDLPAEVRRRFGIDCPAIKKRSSSKRSRAGVGMGAPCAGSCAACGEQFTRYTAFEREHSRPGHRRWQITLDR